MVRQRISLLALLALFGAAAACDSPNHSATRTVLAPRATASSITYRVLTTDAQYAYTDSAIIDENGGTLRIQGNVLVVPPDAVSGPTRFTMRIHAQPYIGAQLTAVAADGSLVTVFPLPLTLTLSYAGARTQIPDQSQIVMLWVQDGVVLERLPSIPDVQGTKVTAQVTHFTDYTPGVPDDPTSGTTQLQ